MIMKILMQIYNNLWQMLIKKFGLKHFYQPQNNINYSLKEKILKKTSKDKNKNNLIQSMEKHNFRKIGCFIF